MVNVFPLEGWETQRRAKQWPEPYLERVPMRSQGTRWSNPWHMSWRIGTTRLARAVCVNAVFGLQTSGLIVQEFYWKKIKNPTTYTSKAKHLKACKSAAHLKPPKIFNRRNAPVFTDLDLRDSPELHSQKRGAAKEPTHRALETRSPASAERAAQNWHFRYH